MKRKRRQTWSDGEQAADFGPSVVRGKDGRLTYQGAANVIIEYRPDPAITGREQLIMAARRKNPLAGLLSHNVITKPMFDAANRLLDEMSIATGGSGGSTWTGIRVAPGSRDTMTERQLTAIRRVNQVVSLLGLNSDTVLWWCLFREDGTPSSFDKRFRLRNGTGADWLRRSLQALDNHFNPPTVASGIKALDKRG